MAFFIVTAVKISNLTELEIIRSLQQLLVTAKVVPSSLIVITQMIQAICSSEMSVSTTATRLKIPEDDVLHSHRYEDFKSYVALTGLTL
jgi:hypothetical protein